MATTTPTKTPWYKTKTFFWILATAIIVGVFTYHYRSQDSVPASTQVEEVQQDRKAAPRAPTPDQAPHYETPDSDVSEWYDLRSYDWGEVQWIAFIALALLGLILIVRTSFKKVGLVLMLPLIFTLIFGPVTTGKIFTDVGDTVSGGVEGARDLVTGTSGETVTREEFPLYQAPPADGEPRVIHIGAGKYICTPKESLEIIEVIQLDMNSAERRVQIRSKNNDPQQFPLGITRSKEEAQKKYAPWC